MAIIESENGDKDYQRLSITREMAQQGVPVLVKNTMFIQSYYSDPVNLLELMNDTTAAKKKNDEYFAKHNVEVKEKKVEVDGQKQAEEKAILAARKAFDIEMERVKQKSGARPKVIRNKDAAAA
jgi:hypothetical protein